ncbi:NACHT domain-containing protein [Streptomyces nanshensis]|uniref:NACHT domain-containing protein n=1 Tax=Streptomyces nanshensis TaxID=518642 RepID=UPI00085C37D0|nr:NACHT domain-containing protein [Streptomyces nanshensis]
MAGSAPRPGPRAAATTGPSGPEPSRIAAVHGSSQGSGYLLSPRLVLTAGHVVENRYLVKVAALGGVGQVECRVVWARRDRECDAALLLAKRDLLPAEQTRALELGAVRWGMPLALETMDACQAIGFPQVQRGDGGELDTEQITGTFKPGSRMVRARYVLDSPYAPPLPRRDGGSPWAGMSGAALFAEGTIIGVVVADPHGWQHGRIEAVRSRVLFEDPEFTEQLVKHTGHRPTVIEFSGEEHNPHAEFERRYAAYVAEYHSELTIFGLDFSRQEHAQWPLDTAYLSLELAPHHSREHPSGGAHEPALGEPAGGGRQRVESAFARERRILLRGLAGSGKTTLVQWLAVTAARQDFPAGLGHFQGCVPFVLPLRTLARRGSLPAPHEFLTAVGNPLGAAQPEGWADQVLSSGRGLLLVDGVDEVQERDRERTQKWLKSLITLYQDCVYLVTTRPSAVADGWLHHQDFTELNLLPMNRQDVTAFLGRWHDAATEAAGRPEDKARLETYRKNLTDVLPRKPDLARLATNPLMCAMICALNRDRDSYLPQNRLELYRAALSMLLVRRDVQRELPRGTEADGGGSAAGDAGVSGAQEALRQDEDAQRQLLQDLAYWMIRNGYVEVGRPEALRIVAQTLRSMPQIAPPEQAGDVLEHLVLRCGLLRAPSPETVEFVHRTFQDYLGAKAAVEGQDLNLVAAHAHEPQWEDVVRMAIGHARAGERAVLLRRLLELGDAAGHPQRERLHLLAAACLEHATSLDPEVRAEVEARAAALVPPGDLAEAEMLAEAGTVVLGLLPPPEALTAAQARPVAHTARLLGGEHAFQVLRAFRESTDPSVRQELAGAWDRFDARTYASDILSHMSLEGVRLVVNGPEQLAVLPVVGAVPSLWCAGGFGAEELAPALRSAAPRQLTLQSDDRLPDLEFLTECAPELTDLHLADCGGLVDYSALARLGLSSLTLQNMPHGPDLSPLREATTLREATFAWLRSGPSRRLRAADVPFAPTLETLVFLGNLYLEDLGGLARYDRLHLLHLPQVPVPVRSLEPLRRLAALRAVFITTIGLCRSAERTVVPLPAITDATVETRESAGRCTAEGLRSLFPSLRRLRLHLAPGPETREVDLSALAGIPDLFVSVRSHTRTPRITGTEELPEGSFAVGERDQENRPMAPRLP